MHVLKIYYSIYRILIVFLFCFTNLYLDSMFLSVLACNLCIFSPPMSTNIIEVTNYTNMYNFYTGDLTQYSQIQG